MLEIDRALDALGLHLQEPPAAPIRAPQFGRSRFEQHGHSLAATHEVDAPGGPRAGTDFFPRVDANIGALHRAHALLVRHQREGLHVGEAASWLLDNLALLDEQLRLIRDGVSRRFYARLPRLHEAPQAGLPRIYAVAWAWVAHTDSGLDETLLSAYLIAYQQTRTLQLAELWALPTTWRVVLLENLRRLAERTALLEIARDAAHLWLDQADDSRSLDQLDRMMTRLAPFKVTEALALQLQQRQDELPEAQARALAGWLLPRLPDPAAALARQQALAAEDHLSVRNAITTLRTMARVDWRELMRVSSPVLHTLNALPVFAAETDATQDQTLRAVQKLARRSGLDETAVAARVAALCLQAADEALQRGMSPAVEGPPPGAAPAWWWQGDGQARLLADLGIRHLTGSVRRPRAERLKARARLYLAVLAGLTALAVAAALQGSLAGSSTPLSLLVLALLLAAPLGEAVVAVVSRLACESARPSALPRLALHHGVPADHRVMVVMPCLLTSRESIEALADQLEQHHIANREPYTQFALLSDWADAPEARTPADDALLGCAQQAIGRLNRRHERESHDRGQAGSPLDPPRFLLLHRDRVHSPSEGCWMGWERKRGKLEQLIHWLAEAQATDRAPQVEDSPFLDLGALSRVQPGTRQLMCLDADTDLPPGRLRELMGVALHPLNRPRLGADGRSVIAGYGILQPRVAVPLPAPEAVTGYHRLYAGACGLDPYSAASSEVYQDLFDEGTFTGKGLLDVRALHAVLDARLPSGQVLSHDLLEGALVRCAAVSDVTVVEDAPVHADVAASRLHRWARGDWQLLPFLLSPRRWPMSLISRWKMLDNLRRSSVAPLSLALLLLVLASGVLPVGRTLMVLLAAACAGPLLGAVAALAPARDDIAPRLFFRQAAGGLGRVAALGLWHLLTLPAQALLQLDAASRALWRQFVSRRQMLQWTTAAAAAAAARTDLPGLWQRHRREVALAGLIGAGLWAWHLARPLAHPVMATVLVGLWVAQPLWVWLVSRPRPVPRRERLAEEDRLWLHALARDTWRWYARHVGAQDNHLPPDNVQRVPHEMVATRTSPTNIGMYLLSAASAQALGLIGRVDLGQRLDATLRTLEHLPRWRGHFLNWYDTRSLQVLAPSYVSTVDSGNCSGHLLVVAAACEALARTPHDAGLAAERIEQSRRALRPLQPLLAGSPSLRALADLVESDWSTLVAQARASAPPAPSPDDAACSGDDRFEQRLIAARAQLEALGLEAAVISPGVPRHVPTDAGAPSLLPQAEPGSMLRRIDDHLSLLLTLWRDEREQEAGTDRDGGDGHPADARPWQQRAARCRALALAADFRPLYDARRKLLHIGLRTEGGQLDEGHYDLLASECRLTSLLAIGKGDVPPAHWGALGRPFFADGRGIGLKSWSGSMFEYLMPSLVLDEPVDSVLQQAVRTAVQVQRREAQAHGTPWGLSESAIAAQDHTLAYQYGPQGAAALALRRTPEDERVIAPYASALAAMVCPSAAVANLRALQALGARDEHGFIEALDYSQPRQIDGSRCVPVRTHMAHHQGMTLVALTDVLLDGLPRRWAARDPLLRATASLLHERAPTEVPPLRPPLPVQPPRRQRSLRVALDVDPLREPLPTTQLLTNGRHSVVLRSHGGGQSLWDGLALTRWRDDLPAEHQGLQIAVRRHGHGGWRSASARPSPDAQTRHTTRHLADRSVIEARWPDLLVRTTVWVSAEDDVELREVTLEATGGQPISLELATLAEVVLAPQRADEAHPAFGQLFLRASWHQADQALYLQRRPRLPDEPTLHAVHFVASGPQPAHDGGRASRHPAEVLGADGVRPLADRARVIGRLGSPAQWLGDGGRHWLQGSQAQADAALLDDDDLVAVEDAGDLPAADMADRAPQSTVLPDDTAPDLPGRALDTGLDPVASLRMNLTLRPGQPQRVTFGLAAARTLEPLQALVDRYRRDGHVERSSSMSHTMAAIRLRELQFDADTWTALLHLNTRVSALCPRDLPPLPSARPLTGGAQLRCDRRLLWRHGLSGERAIVLVQIGSERGLPLITTLKKALRAWSAGGLGVDLVVINQEPPSYLAPVQRQLTTLRERLAQQLADVEGGRRSALHVLPAAELSADERHTLVCLARVRLHGDGRSLAQQLEREQEEAREDQAHREAAGPLAVRSAWPGRRPRVAEPPAPEWRFDGEPGDVVFDVSPQSLPQRPWINVLANEGFGCLVSERGSGCTWAGNSRMHQLTAWSNDPLTDPPGEHLWLHDLDRDQVWPLGAWLDEGSPRQVRHGLGHTTMVQEVDGLQVTLCWCVDRDLAVKQLTVRLRLAQGTGRRRVRLVAAADWQMGDKAADRLTVLTDSHRFDAGPSGVGLPAATPVRVLTATQLDHMSGHGLATAFLTLRLDAPRLQGADEMDWTCDRREFLDAVGRRVLPRRLLQRTGPGLDPCAALGVHLELQAGDEAGVAVLTGHASDPAQARELAEQAWSVAPTARLQAQRDQWVARQGAVQVRTPDAAFDALVNHWLPYQTLACRMWARAAFYQAGGAYGYRDQLQDAMSLVGRDPRLLARQIRIHAARQFPEGDVQHWWHAPGGAGVRTHFSDDLLWLPLACALYVERTGDATLLDERVPFLDGGTVPPGREDLYETPRVSTQDASILEHAARAIEHGLRSGAHGLPLMGTGDWNDGMNRIGHEGRGESVWLGWFACHVIEQFAPLAEARGMGARVGRWQAVRTGWQQALDEAGWDGHWYRRAFFDDGTPLGSADNSECRIDLIAQAWAVLSEAGRPERARQAMASARALLVDPCHGLIRLLHPPLQHQRPAAGYIQAYPGGVRENGGQYNHGAVWAMMAWARLGDADAAWHAFRCLSPAHRSQDPVQGPRYRIEPWVMAGDVYTAPPYEGRGGWSWYTGSAGWLARAAQEDLLGVVLMADGLHLRPCLPAHWPQAEVRLQRPDGRTLTVRLQSEKPGTEMSEPTANAVTDSARRLRVQAPARLSWARLEAVDELEVGC